MLLIVIIIMLTNKIISGWKGLRRQALGQLRDELPRVGQLAPVAISILHVAYTCVHYSMYNYNCNDTINRIYHKV